MPPNRVAVLVPAGATLLVSNTAQPRATASLNFSIALGKSRFSDSSKTSIRKNE